MMASRLRLRLHYKRNEWRRKSRIFFPSPAEVKFVQIMGGHVLTLPFIKSAKNSFPLTIFLSMGKTLKRELVQREVRVGAMYVDFAFITSYSKKAIEIDGKNFHRDIVREQQRDDYLADRGWQVVHIEASELWHRPRKVKARVLKFLAN